MDTGVQIALIGIGGPLSMLIVGAILQHWQKQSDYARQDQVAADAKKANAAIIDGQKQAANLLLSNNEQVKHLGEETQKQIKIVHSMLNSEKTEAKKEALDTAVNQLASLREIVDLKKVAGHEPTVEALASIEAICLKIDIMKKDLEAREKQNAIANEILTTPSRLDSMFDDTVKAVSKKDEV